MVQPEKVIPPVLHYLSPLHCPSLSFVTWPQRHTVVTFCMKKCQHGALSALFLNRILMSWALFLYLTHCFPHSHWEAWQNVSTESLGAISAWFYVHNKFAGLFSLLFKKKKYIFLTRLICCLVSEKKTARWGARKRREAVIDCLLVCDLFHMKHTWHSCQRFLFAPFLVSFTLLITLLISDAIKCFTVCALAQGSGGVARVALYQGKHAACLTTHITLLLCHYNSAPLKLEHLGTLTTPPPALCSPAYKKSVLLVAKTNPISQWHSCILLNLMHVLQFSLQFTQWLFFPHLLPDTCY